MGPLAFVLVWLCVSAQDTELQDGTPNVGVIESFLGGRIRYHFSVDAALNTTGEDLSVTVTTYSDSSYPSLYMSLQDEPSPESHTWESVGWGSASIVLTEGEISKNQQYNVLVVCTSQCRYTITLSYIKEVSLQDGQVLYDTLRPGRNHIYQFIASDPPPLEYIVTVTPNNTGGRFDVWVAENKEPSNENSLPVKTSWHAGKMCSISPVTANSTYLVNVISQSGMDYIISATSSNGTRELQASVPTQGQVNASQFISYKIYVDNPNETLIVQLTTYVGEVDMYIRYGKPPTPEKSDFNTTHYGNETIIIDKHQRKDLNGPTGDYFIRVVGFSQSVFTITASVNNNSFVPLLNGISQNGYVDHKEVDLYYLAIPPETDQNITIRVSAIFGNPDLYAKLCTSSNQSACLFTPEMIKTPKNFPGLYSSKHQTGDENIEIPHNGTLCSTAPCGYAIGVSGKSSDRTRFSITASYDEETEHRLMEGVPMKTTLRSSGFLYFKYTVFNETVMNLTIQLTPVTGDPDLYVSRGDSLPTLTEYEKSSTKSSALIDSVNYVRGPDGITLVGTYHIAVFSFDQTTFGIVATERIPGRNSTILIYSGQSQKDMLYNYTDSDYRIYFFTIHYTEETQQPIRISLTQLTGKFMLYVANRLENLDWEKEIFYYDWCSCDNNTNDQARTINILPTDPLYRRDSIYLILVQAMNFTLDHSASYILTYTSGDGLVSLQEGLPFPDEVTEKAYKNYAFPIHYNHEDITITVSALTGDPDLYISLQANNTHPTKENFDKRSTSYGGEVMSLQWEQGIKDLCPGLPDEYTFGEQMHCMMYISVYGYRAAIYTITVTARKDVPTLLALGTPAIGQLTKSHYRYYYAHTFTSLSLSVMLQSLYGDADLYLNVFDLRTNGGVVAEWTRPNHEVSDYKSQSAAALDRIDVAADVLSQTCSSGSCIALIGVYCFSESCSYSVSGSQEEALLLNEGQPQMGHLNAMDYAYYTFYNDKNFTTLLIILTAISGDPDLYVSKGNDKRPTSESYDWASRGWRGESLLISPNDTAFNTTYNMRGYYIIGVKAVTNSTFTLTVTTDPEPVLILLSGVPMNGQTVKERAAFFEYYHGNASDITIRLTPKQGVATLQVTSNKVGAGAIYENLPTLGNSTWSSATSGVQNTVIIRTTDPAFCFFCTYIIGVFSQTKNCSFSLVVSSGSEIVMLSNGVPLQDTVQADQWKYYRFYSDGCGSDIDVSLTNYAGDADLFISTTDVVSEGIYNWTRQSKNHVEHVRIKKSDQNVTQPMYLIGIKGVKNTSYSITVHGRDTAITLVDGWPSTYSVMLRHSDHLYFDYPLSSNVSLTVQCMIRPLSLDFWPNVLVLFTNDTKKFPTAENCDQNLDSQAYDYLYRTMTFNLANDSFGFFRIGVFGAPIQGASREEMGSFEISCSTQVDSMVLRSGMIAVGTLKQYSPQRRYTVYVPEISSLEVILIPCQGKVTLSISSNYSLSEESGSDIVISPHPVDGRIIGEVPNAQGQYYLLVKGLHHDQVLESDFELSVVVTPKGQKLPLKVVAGNDGQLTWVEERRELISLNWSPAEYENGDQISGDVDYFVFASKSLTLKMNTVCAIRSSQRLGETWLAHSFLRNESLPVQVELPTGATVLVNVVARLQTQENSLLTTVPYIPTEVVMRDIRRGRRVGLVVMGLIAGTLVAALVGLCVMYRKYKKVKRQLEHEMTDIMKVASISSEQLDPDTQWSDAPRRGLSYIPLEIAKP